MIKRTKIACVVAAAFTAAGCASPGFFRAEPALLVAPGAPSALASHALGTRHLMEGRYAQAASAFLESLRADPKSVQAFNGLGIAYANLGQYEAAIASFQAAIRISPGAAHLYNNLGYTLMLDGRALSAVAVLERAERLEPGNPRTARNLTLARELSSPPSRNSVAQVKAEAPTPPESMIERIQVIHSQGGAVVPLRATEPEFVRVGPSIYALTSKPVGTAASASAGDAAKAIVAVTKTGRAEISLQTSESSHSALTNLRVTTSANAANEAVQVGTFVSDGPLAPLVSRSVSARERPNERAITRSPLFSGTELEVSNGNGIAGLAREVADHLIGEGAAQGARITNQRGFAQGRTEIHYRPGHQAAAEALRHRLPGNQDLVETEALSGGTNVRLILGHDFTSARLTSVRALLYKSTADESAPSNPEAANRQYRSLSGAELEISNGNGVHRLAATMADYFSRQGIAFGARLTNQPGFHQLRTEMRHRKGFRTIAELLCRQVPGQCTLIETEDLKDGTNLCLVLGHDLPTEVAALAKMGGSTFVAARE